jgi:hypothetical protein
MGERLVRSQAVVKENKLMRSPVTRVVALTGAATLVGVGFLATAGTAAAKEEGPGTGFEASVFATGGTAFSAVDDITAMEGSVFVSWQNGVGPKGEPAGNGTTQSTVAQYSSSGRLINSWQLTGRCDGMAADSQHDRIIATVNEDGNSSLVTITPDAPKPSQLVHYTYSPSALPHGGGTDAPHIYRGQILISASNPSDTTRPAVYRATLSGTTATLASVFNDNSNAIVANTNDPAHGKQVTLTLTDPDSNSVVPSSSPRFGGDFVLDSQGDQQQVYVRNAGRPGQQLFALNLSQSVDDTVWASSSRGTLYATDGKSTAYALRGNFKKGTAFSAVTPGNANNAPPSPGPNYLATLDLNTGVLTPVAG